MTTTPNVTTLHDHDHDHNHEHSHGQVHDHDHDHSHGHEHSRRSTGSIESAPLGGPILIDIGGDVGALIVRLDDDLEGTEIPIESLDDPTLEKHTGIWRRQTGLTSVVVAVFPDLLEGQYRLISRHGKTHDVTVHGGEISDLDLRTGSLSTHGKTTIDRDH